MLRASLGKWLAPKQIDKVYPDIPTAFGNVVKSGQTLLIGGFGICGTPHALLKQLSTMDVDNLLVVSNNAGLEDYGSGLLLRRKQISSMILSTAANNDLFNSMYNNGDIEVEFTPQGTLAERIRCGGAGIPAFYTHTAVGTMIQTGDMVTQFAPGGKTISKFSKLRETRIFDGKTYLLEEAIQGDVALIKAWKADRMGNLVFRGTAMNLNVAMAKAAETCIAEVEEIVETGELDPDHIHLPGVFVDRLVKPDPYEKRIEFKTVNPPNEETTASTGVTRLEELDLRERIARRAALEFINGQYINLGVGIPTLTAKYIPKGIKVDLQSENGMLRMGPFPPSEAEVDPDLVNSERQTVSYLPGSAVFTSDASFAMIRGGHVDLTMLGAMQVSADGDLADWITPENTIKGMGGSMDLVSSGMPTVVLMSHCTKDGRPKILTNCTLPLSGSRCVDRIITELAVFDVDKNGTDGLTLVELAPSVTLEHVMERTAAPFTTSSWLKTMKYSGL